MKELSVFVDESGHFDMESRVSPYYLVSFVFHDQACDITDLVLKMNTHLAYIGYPNHCVHTEPIIRSEDVYRDMPAEDRHKLFDALVYFTRRSPIKHKTFFYRKKEFKDKMSLISTMARDISRFCVEKSDFFNSFDVVKLYYDNGQGEITWTLTSTLSIILPHITFRTVKPSGYKFFQVADLLCTLRLIEEKYKDNGKMSKSETYFFRSHTAFRKNYLSIADHLAFE